MFVPHGSTCLTCISVLPPGKRIPIICLTCHVGLDAKSPHEMQLDFLVEGERGEFRQITMMVVPTMHILHEMKSRCCRQGLAPILRAGGVTGRINDFSDDMHVVLRIGGEPFPSRPLPSVLTA